MLLDSTVAAVCDRRGQSIPLGGSSSVRTEISDFIAAKRRKKTGKLWQNHGGGNFYHRDHGLTRMGRMGCEITHRLLGWHG
jgi:hypothetical protein